MRGISAIALLVLCACPSRHEPETQYGWQDDPNGGHPVEYRTAPSSSGGGLLQNLMSGGAGYMLGRMHGGSKTQSAPPPAPVPTYRMDPVPSHQWKTPPPAPRSPSVYRAPSGPSHHYSAPARRSYSTPSRSGGARGRYSR